MTKGLNQYQHLVAFHPGETLSEKLEELGMGPKEFALRSCKPEKTVIAVMNGESSITPEMAVQFERVLQIPAHFWLATQSKYDEFIAREKQKALITRSAVWLRKFPVGDMIKKGWLAGSSSVQEKTEALLTFFGMNGHEAWDDYYLNQELKVAFRISLRHTKDPYAISAWLRRGEIQAEELEARAYDEKAFKAALLVVKSIMAQHPEDFFRQLQHVCLKAGVKVVHTPCISKAPINGCARWRRSTPLIQMSGRYKRNDIFWFTFFHEAGHILLHGKKDIFLEGVHSDRDENKENEADEFAVKWTFPREAERELLRQPNLREADIQAFAERFNTHPAMIIGRLHHKKLLKHDVGREFFQTVELT